MSQPLVSIILPNYNHAPYLKRRLESIFQQTYINTEIILLDDYSQDESISLLDDYIDYPKVSHYLRNKKNGASPFKQWKKGIELAKGKYIWIAESDDWAKLDFLEKLVPILENDEAIAAAYCQSKKVNKKGKVIDDMVHYTEIFTPNKWKAAYINLGNNEIQNFLVYKNTIPNASAVVFRNDRALIQYINQEMMLTGDWWFWVKLVKDKKIAFLPERLNFFRSHAESTRENLNLLKKKQNILESLAVLNLIESYFPVTSSKVLQQRQRLKLKLVHWVYPKEYASIHYFIKTHFPNNQPFFYLLIQAYWAWFTDKIKGVGRRYKRSKSRIQKEKSSLKQLSSTKTTSVSKKYPPVKKSLTTKE